MEHGILVYLALALVAYPFLFLIYEIWRHGSIGQTVPYVNCFIARMRSIQ